MQNLTKVQEEDLFQIIADEHAKQQHWKEALKIEDQQLKAAKARETSDKETVQKRAVLERKTKAELEMSQEDARRKAVVDEVTQSIATGSTDNGMHSIARVLTEFLSKFISI